MLRCHKCGYSNQHNAKTCIKCRTNLVNKEESLPEPADPNPINRKTVVMGGGDETPWDQDRGQATPKNRSLVGAQTVRRFVPNPDSCCLVAISLEDEKELRKIDVDGEMLSLNRELLDPGNNSISRGSQANLFQVDGNWYLENTSTLKTTFIQVKEPIKLSDGDVVLMGDSLFKFKVGTSANSGE